VSEASEPRTRADKWLHQPASDAATASGRCRCSTATLSSPAGDIVVLRVAGEVDLSSCGVLDAALDDVLDRRPDHLIVDLTGLVFSSCHGLTAITQAVHAATADGIRYSLSGASPLFSRLWPHYWPDGDAPRIHRTTAAAVLSAVALQADRWSPVPTTDVERQHLVDGRHDPDRQPARLEDEVDDDDPPGLAGGRHASPAASPAALRQALHRHRSATCTPSAPRTAHTPWRPTSPRSCASPSPASPPLRRSTTTAAARRKRVVSMIRLAGRPGR
jgi:anti-anti-sigma factor